MATGRGTATDGGGTGRTGAYLTTRMTTLVSLSRVEKANSAFATSCVRIWRATTNNAPNALPTSPPTGVVGGSRVGSSHPSVVASGVVAPESAAGLLRSPHSGTHRKCHAGSRCTVTHSWCAQCKWYRCSINCSIIIQSIAFSRLIRARMHYICDFTFRRLKSCIYVPRSYNVPRATIPPYNVPHSGRCKRSSDPFTLDVPRYTYFCPRVRYMYSARCTQVLVLWNSD